MTRRVVFFTMKTLSDRIRTILTEQSVSQAELSRIVGVTKTAVNMWLNGKTQDIDFTRAKAIEDRFGYNAEWVAYGTKPVHSPRHVSHEMKEIFDLLTDLDFEGGERREDVIYFIKRLLPMPSEQKTA